VIVHMLGVAEGVIVRGIRGRGWLVSDARGTYEMHAPLHWCSRAALPVWAPILWGSGLQRWCTV
jgi:hypothetical protein